jgi:uncharacterized delta-60 repeat protein
MSKSILHLFVMILMGSLVCTVMANAQETPQPSRGVVIVKIGNGTFASGVEIQKDGKILISASSYVDNQGQSVLLRRNADGSPDQSFGKAGMVVTGLSGFYIHTEGMALQEDGKIVLTGRAIPLARNKWSRRSNDDFLVIRYNPDGQRDKSFNGSGWAQTDIDGDIDVAYGLPLQKDRKIFVIGNTSK